MNVPGRNSPAPSPGITRFSAVPPNNHARHIYEIVEMSTTL